MLTILTTACGSMFMPGFFRCLYENGERQIKIIGVDAAPVNYMSEIIDAFYQVPSYSDPNYLNIILDICKKEKVDVIFPQISGELELFAFNRDIFDKENIKLALSNPDTLKIANNKLALYKKMRNSGLNAPEFMEVRNNNDLDLALTKFGFPERNVCIKIADGSGQRGVRIVTSNTSATNAFLHQKPGSILISRQDMETIINDLAGSTSLIAMPALQMPEYTVDLLADNGNTLYIGGRMNMESNMSIAQRSITHTIPEAFDLCKGIVKDLKLDGNIGFDFMFDEDGRPQLTDLNPRITATIVLFFEAGVNFPYLRVKQLLGEKLPECTIEEGVTLIRKYRDIFIK